MRRHPAKVKQEIGRTTLGNEVGPLFEQPLFVTGYAIRSRCYRGNGRHDVLCISVTRSALRDTWLHISHSTWQLIASAKLERYESVVGFVISYEH
jgi:hypothetical protein